jgi:hypothetical protein
MSFPLTRTCATLVFGAAALLGLSACGGSSSGGGTAAAPSASATSAASPTDTAAAMMAQHEQAFCANAKSIGSLTKSNAAAMAMSPAESAKDFKALADKVAALKPDAPAALQPDIQLIAADLGLEQMVMAHKADGTSAEQEMAQMNGQKSSRDAAVARLITSVKTSCAVDIS